VYYNDHAKERHQRPQAKSKVPPMVYRHFGLRTLRTQDTSDLPKFGPRTLRHDQSVPTLRHWCRSVCKTDTSVLDSTYIEDQSHCILCKGLPLNRRE